MPIRSASPKSKPKGPRGLRIIAGFKLFKGILLIGIGLGLFKLVNKNLADMAQQAAVALNLDLDNHYVHLVLENVVKIQPQTLKHAGIWSLAYSCVLLVEGTGLWLRKRWAEFFTIVATGFFVPWEVHACIHRFTWLKLGALIVNVGILVYIIQLVLFRKRT